MAEVDWGAINDMFAELDQQGRKLLLEAGAGAETIRIERSADMCMLGQFHQIRVPIPSGRLSSASTPEIRNNFNHVYRSRYSYLNEEIDLEFVHWHLHAVAPVSHVNIKETDPVTENELATALKGSRKAYFLQLHDFTDTPVYDRYKLRPGMPITGPALIEERESTAVLRPGDYATIDQFLNLVVEVGG
jgi:N-methylhydantoinase A/oxoprolinase/acetone carboxylase beta subunit